MRRSALLLVASCMLARLLGSEASPSPARPASVVHGCGVRGRKAPLTFAWFAAWRAAMGDKNELIRTVRQIAERVGRSERTVYRWLQRQEAACFELVPISNTGGGAPAVRAGEANSFDALFDVRRAEVSSLRAEAGRRGGHARSNDPNAPA